MSQRRCVAAPVFCELQDPPGRSRSQAVGNLNKSASPPQTRYTCDHGFVHSGDEAMVCLPAGSALTTEEPVRTEQHFRPSDANFVAVFCSGDASARASVVYVAPFESAGLGDESVAIAFSSDIQAASGGSPGSQYVLWANWGGHQTGQLKQLSLAKVCFHLTQSDGAPALCVETVPVARFDVFDELVVGRSCHWALLDGPTIVCALQGTSSPRDGEIVFWKVFLGNMEKTLQESVSAGTLSAQGVAVRIVFAHSGGLLFQQLDGSVHGWCSLWEDQGRSRTTRAFPFTDSAPVVALCPFDAASAMFAIEDGLLVQRDNGRSFKRQQRWLCVRHCVTEWCWFICDSVSEPKLIHRQRLGQVCLSLHVFPLRDMGIMLTQTGIVCVPLAVHQPSMSWPGSMSTQVHELAWACVLSNGNVVTASLQDEMNVLVSVDAASHLRSPVFAGTAPNDVMQVFQKRVQQSISEFDKSLDLDGTDSMWLAQSASQSVGIMARMLLELPSVARDANAMLTCDIVCSHTRAFCDMHVLCAISNISEHPLQLVSLLAVGTNSVISSNSVMMAPDLCDSRDAICIQPGQIVRALLELRCEPRSGAGDQGGIRVAVQFTTTKRSTGDVTLQWSALPVSSFCEQANVCSCPTRAEHDRFVHHECHFCFVDLTCMLSLPAERPQMLSELLFDRFVRAWNFVALQSDTRADGTFAAAFRHAESSQLHVHCDFSYDDGESYAVVCARAPRTASAALLIIRKRLRELASKAGAIFITPAPNNRSIRRAADLAVSLIQAQYAELTTHGDQTALQRNTDKACCQLQQSL